MTANSSVSGLASGPGWELFSHDADIGVRGFGRTVAAAFENAARAMTAAIVDPAEVQACKPVTISCEAPDGELLLVDWLNALVFEMSTQSMLFGVFDVDIDIDNGRLEATAIGEPIESERHAPAVEVKGATYTELKVVEGSNGVWVAQCVIDV